MIYISINNDLLSKFDFAKVKTEVNTQLIGMRFFKKTSDKY